MFCSPSSHSCNIFCSGSEKRGPLVQENIKFRNYENTTNAKNNTKQGGGGEGRGIIDEVVVSALSTMGFEDRQRQLNEQHGVFDTTLEETPEFVSCKVNELDMEIHKQLLKWKHNNNTNNLASSLSSSTSPAPGILVAQAMDPIHFGSITYNLRLRVLRNEHFDTVKAAIRLIRYFDLKLEAFGSTTTTNNNSDNNNNNNNNNTVLLKNNITVEDLTAQDVQNLQKGFLQYIQGRDSVGRRIYVMFPSIVELGEDPKSLARLFLYYDSFVNQTDEKDLGYVLLIFHVGPPSADARSKECQVWWRATLLATMPSAIHTCFYATNNHLLITKASIVMLPPELRAKIKVHSGSQTEWMYELMGYGIPQQLIPLSINGEIKLKNHLVFMDYRKKLLDYCARHHNTTNNNHPFGPALLSSGQVQQQQVFEIPNNQDVLFGRGRPFQNHMGNVRLQYWVEEHIRDYDAAKDKQTVVNSIIQKVVHQRHGHFLSQENNRSGLWMIVDPIVAKEKVSQMFRNARKKKLLLLASTTTSTSTTTTSSSRRNTSSTISKSTTTTTTTTMNPTTTTITTTMTNISNEYNDYDIVDSEKEGLPKQDQKQKQKEDHVQPQTTTNAATTTTTRAIPEETNGHGPHSLMMMMMKRPRQEPQQYTFAGRFFYDVNDNEQE